MQKKSYRNQTQTILPRNHRASLPAGPQYDNEGQPDSDSDSNLPQVSWLWSINGIMGSFDVKYRQCLNFSRI